MDTHLQTVSPTPRKMDSFQVSDGAKIYYELYGESDSPLIVMTYGLACLINHWHFQIDEFSKTHQILVYDIRGHHKSTRGKDEISVELLATDIKELMDHIQLEIGSFWGHSYGGPISLRMGSLYPDMVSSIVMVNGFYQNPFLDIVDTPDLIGIFDQLEEFQSNAPEFTQWVWKNLIDSPIFGYLAGVSGGFNLERSLYRDIEVYSKGVSLIQLPIFFEHIKAMLRFDGSKYFEETFAPTLVIHGDRDGIIPKSQNQEMSQKLNNSRFISFEEGSHCSQLDVPRELNSEIRSFFESQDPQLKLI